MYQYVITRTKCKPCKFNQRLIRAVKLEQVTLQAGENLQLERYWYILRFWFVICQMFAF